MLQGRLPGQAPEIDPVVYLDETGPEDCAVGTIVQARITGAREYDLVAVPIS